MAGSRSTVTRRHEPAIAHLTLRAIAPVPAARRVDREPWHTIRYGPNLSA